jgi:hypothetical protein
VRHARRIRRTLFETHLAILDKLHTNHEALAAHVTDNVVLLLELCKPRNYVVTDHETILLQILTIHDFQSGQSNGRRHRIPTKRVEVQLAHQRLGNRRRSHNSSHRETIANALGHSDHVGNDTVLLKAPAMSAEAAESRLNFVADADAAGLAHSSECLLEKSARKLHSATNTLDALGEKACDLAARRVPDEIVHLLRVLCGCLAFAGAVARAAHHLADALAAVAAAPWATVRIGVGDMVHAKAVRHVVFPRVQVGEPHGVRTVLRRQITQDMGRDGSPHSVVRVAEGEEIKVPGVQACEKHGHIVRLGATVHKVHHLYRSSELGTDALSTIRSRPSHLEVPRQTSSERLGILVNLRVHVDVRSVPEPI